MSAHEANYETKSPVIQTEFLARLWQEALRCSRVQWTYLTFPHTPLASWHDLDKVRARCPALGKGETIKQSREKDTFK